MANSIARAAVIAVVGAVTIAGAAEADSTATPSVVLHVTDYISVPPHILAEAQEVAARVYARIGVTVEWTDGSAALAPNNGALHLDVVFLSRDMPTYQQTRSTTFGQASAVTRRAYIFFGRVLDHSRATFSDPARVLALVLAHEVGHMLMPGVHHSKTGLMRGDWVGTLYEVPALSGSEAAAIRSWLTARR